MHYHQCRTCYDEGHVSYDIEPCDCDFPEDFSECADHMWIVDADFTSDLPQ